MLDAHKCTVYLADEDMGEFVGYGDGTQGLGGMEVRVKMGGGVLGHVWKNQKVVNLSQELEQVLVGGQGGVRATVGLDLSSGVDVKLDSDYKTTSLLCVPIWMGEGGIKIGDSKVVGVIMVQNKQRGEREFGKFDESLLCAFAEFLGASLQNADLHTRAMELSRSVHAEFAGMSGRIDELLSSKDMMETANDLMNAEQESGQIRVNAIQKLMAVERELDQQSAAVDAGVVLRT